MYDGFALPIVPIMVDLRVMVGSTLTSIWESQCMLEVISGVMGAMIVDMYNKKEMGVVCECISKEKEKRTQKRSKDLVPFYAHPPTAFFYHASLVCVCRNSSRIRHQRPCRRI